MTSTLFTALRSDPLGRLLKIIRATHHFVFSWESLTVKLIVPETTVVLRGISASEREEAPLGCLRGVLQLKVKRSCVRLDSVNIKFLGECIDAIYTKELSRRVLSHVHKTLIHDTCRYTSSSNVLSRGTYNFPFHFVIDPSSPETVFTVLGSRSYQIQVFLKRASSGYRSIVPDICKSIRMIRAPIDTSLIVNDNIEASGTWGGVMPYYVAVSSRVCHLGSSFEMCFETYPNPWHNVTGHVRFIKVVFVQKIRCPQKETGEHYSINNKQLLFLETFDLSKDDPYKPVMVKADLKIPDKLCFPVHPCTSNNEITEDEITTDLRISHFLHVTIGVSPVQIKSKMNSDLEIQSSEEGSGSGSGSSSSFQDVSEKSMTHEIKEFRTFISFRAHVFLLDGDAIGSSLAPPKYTKGGEKYEHKSQAWLCSNGRFDDGRPPRYST